MNDIPYGKQSITDEDVQAVVETLRSDFLTQGPKVEEFESAFANYIGTNYAIAVSNATAALHLSVLALGLGPQDRVITTSNTFAATANCARFVGAEVWFVDIDPDTFLMDLNLLEELIESKPKGFFKGIIPVDFAGLPINLELLKKLASRNNLWIIEDACHAPGGYFVDSKGKRQNCGNCNYADIGVFSFHPVKHIACGEGGMVTTNSKELYDQIKLLRTHGISKANMKDDHGGWYYEMHELGFNYRLTDIQAALGITQLAKNNLGIRKRNKIANNYITAFKGKIKYQKQLSSCLNAYHLFVIEVNNRKGLYEYLRSNNIYAQVHYIPLHTLPYYKLNGFKASNMIHSEQYYEGCISLPIFPTLQAEEQSFVIDNILNFNNA